MKHWKASGDVTAAVAWSPWKSDKVETLKKQLSNAQMFMTEARRLAKADRPEDEAIRCFCKAASLVRWLPECLQEERRGLEEAAIRLEQKFMQEQDQTLY